MYVMDLTLTDLLATDSTEFKGSKIAMTAEINGDLISLVFIR